MFAKKQSGSALMVALMVVVLMIAMIALMTISNNTAIQRSTAIDQRQQTRLYAHSANNLVIKILTKVMHKQRLTSSDQPWALSGATFPIGDAILSGNVKDMRSCYNVNVLYDAKIDDQQQSPAVVEILVRLMILLDIDEPQARTLTARIWDYIDADTVSRSNGAEDNRYINKKTPFLTANQMISDISELRLVDGITNAIYKKISPYLCALPDTSLKINLNTLSDNSTLLLKAVSNNAMNESNVPSWLSNRPLGGWRKVSTALNATGMGLDKKTVKDIKSFFIVKSDYFRFDGTLIGEGISYQWFALLNWHDPTMNIILQMETQRIL
ncbi:MAG: type II secretion system minor pseudopilin GspK [Gammaproteobacteria bacterium]|nr:type II secretion system minor pseudopilin GspK [Gammaproteobacteria bacterium]